MASHALLLLLLVPLLCGAAPAAAPAQKEELKQLRKRINALQEALAASEETKTESADALRESERAISETNRVLRGLEEEQRAVNARSAELQEQSRRMTGDIEAQRARLARQLYQQYIGAQPNGLKLLFNREDPNLIAREFHYLTYLARARSALIGGLRANLGRVTDLAQETNQQRAELATINAAQQAQRKRLESEKTRARPCC